MPNLKFPCGQNPLALAGREKARPNVYAELLDLEDQNRRTICRTLQLRGYNMA